VIRLLETGGLDTAGTALNIDKLQIIWWIFLGEFFTQTGVFQA
jgi:hypothetical protein